MWSPGPGAVQQNYKNGTQAWRGLQGHRTTLLYYYALGQEFKRRGSGLTARHSLILLGLTDKELTDKELTDVAGHKKRRPQQSSRGRPNAARAEV